MNKKLLIFTICVFALALILTVVHIGLLLWESPYFYKQEQYDNFSYSEWQNGEDDTAISVHTKNSQLGENVFYAEGKVCGEEVIINFDMMACTVTFYKRGKPREYAYGFADFERDNITIEIKRSQSDAIKNGFVIYRKK